MVQGSTTTSTVPATSNKVSAVGASAYTYDLAGNLTGDGTNTYAWDNAGQLSTVKLGATTLGTYTYDWQHKRSKKVAGANTTLYVYGPNGLLYGEYTTTSALVREYIYLDDQPLAQITAGSPETVTYLHVDHLNTPRYATNAAGTQVWAWAPDAFGTSTPTGTATINLRFPGQYADAESGLFYNWNRYYKASIGRYISPDPIGIEGGLNLFSYVGQNPVMGNDPWGLVEYSNDFIGPLPPNGYWTSQMTITECGIKIPPGPPGASLENNMWTASQHYGNFNWLYEQVRLKGPWDYKQIHPRYEDFGNFHYGAIGSAFGARDWVLRRAAGWAQRRSGNDTKDGTWYGRYPYGDDRQDQYMIDKGINYGSGYYNYAW